MRHLFNWRGLGAIVFWGPGDQTTTGHGGAQAVFGFPFAWGAVVAAGQKPSPIVADSFSCFLIRWAL